MKLKTISKTASPGLIEATDRFTITRGKPATVAELIAVIAEFNRAHDLDLKHKLPAGTPNPLLDNLYIAATAAAKSLQPFMAVEVKTVPGKQI